ncbi:SMI1/KNR4 family protein [Kitasatospora sp. NPDC057223]|uniref:SMI1/KNR4 family protein n=1 Tax=Kitasatospora sp. NPDC057223 TaxID=3346055 RepID=UPI0036425C0F
MHLGIERLSQILSPENGADERVDWAAARVSWGADFPEDYRAFMAVFGSGSVSDEMDILAPAPVGSSLVASMAEVTADARHAWAMEGRLSDLDVDPDHILPWGVTSGPDLLCWLTTAEDPDCWPVLVIGRHTRPMFMVYPFGMTEFLSRLLGEDSTAWERWPLSIGRPLWVNPAASFVHWQVQESRWQAGLDPATGQPSTYPEGF